MAPTKGSVARPERRWDCHRSTPTFCGSQKYSRQFALAILALIS